MPSTMGIVSGGIRGLGNILGSNKSARQRTAVEPPEFAPLRDLLLQRATERLKTPSSLPEGFLATGIQNINRQADLAQQSLENRLGGAGLLGSGVHGAGLTNLETTRFGNIANLENIGIPRLEREFSNQDIELATRLFGQRVPGTQFEGSGPVATGLSSAAELLGELYGAGELGADVAKGVGLGGGAAAPLASTLAGTVGVPIAGTGTVASGTGALSGTGLSGLGSALGGAGAAGAAGATGAGLVGAGVPAFGTTLATGALTPTAPGFAGAATAGGAGAGGGGIAGTLGALVSNPLTWIAAGGLGAALIIGKIGQGRKTADRIVPTQNQVTNDLAQANDAFWKGHAAGQVTSPQHVQNYLSQLEDIRKSFFNWVGGVKGDERARSQARATIGGLIDQIQRDTRAAFAPFGLNPVG